MKRLGILVLLAGLCGCGVHLGDKYGRRTRAAFDAQIAKGDGGNAISGEDAKLVMRTHLGRGQGTSASNPSMGSSYTSSNSGNNAGGVVIRQPTPDSPIRLDAVR